jgi:hypothetical protein
MSDAATHEPDPQPGGEIVAGYVLADIRARYAAGIRKYGGPLMTHNGRNALWDAYQEVLDLAMYLRQVLLEQEAQ